jgi:LysM repeat protein
MGLHRSLLFFVAAVAMTAVLRADVQAGANPSFSSGALSSLATPYRSTLPVIQQSHGLSGDAVLVGHPLTGSARTARPTPTPSPRSTSRTSRSTSSSCGSAVTARRGDTMSGIARRCGVSASTLASSNGLRTSSTLGVGQTLVLRSGSPQVPTPTRVPARPLGSYADP